MAHVGAEPMESSGATSMEEVASKAADNFENEFNFRNMDKMIHRFPPGLGKIISNTYPYMVVPRFVAIGPYHHRKEDLYKMQAVKKTEDVDKMEAKKAEDLDKMEAKMTEDLDKMEAVKKAEDLDKMEAVKKAAAHFLWQRSKRLEQAVKKAAAHYKRSENLALDDDATEVVDALDEARDMYIADKTVTQEGMMMDDAQFAEMMIYDACFLLVYMDAYTRSFGKDEDYQVEPSMRRFLFSNRGRINNDIMLLENQLPWRVMRVLIGLASELKLKETVGYFIAAVGSSFKISESSNLKPYEWDDKEENPLPHLLALLRRHKTEEPDKVHSACATAEPGGNSISVDVLSDDEDVGNNNNHPPSPSMPQDEDEPLITNPPPPTQVGNRDEVVVSAISPMDLEQIGIYLTADPTAKFSDMVLEKGLLWSHLKLAPLSLDDTGASWLVNMAAFEVCTGSRFGDPPDRTAICSYLKLLAFFMVGSEDVRRLRLMGLLNGANKDDDMLAFFDTLKKHLPDYGTHFAMVMRDIEEYKKKRPIRTTLYKWVYNNWKTIGAVLSIIFAVVTAIAALIRLYQAIVSLVHKN